MKSMVFFLYNLGLAGAERVTIRLANYFSKKGMNVIILTVAGNELLFDKINPEVEVISLNKKKIKHVILPLIRFVKTHKVDFFISNIWPLTLISLVTRLTSFKSKLIFIEHGILSEEYKNRSVLFNFFQNLSLKIGYLFAHKVVAVSKGVKKDLIKKGVKKSKISVIYNPINEWNRNSSFQKTKNVESWWESKQKRIISVGRLKQEKNFPNLINAIKLLNEDYELSLKLLILGEGEKRKELESLIENQNLSDDIFLPGEVINPIPYISKADLFVLSSDYEGFGLVIVEALSVGKTIVSTNCKSGPNEILKGGKFGYLCKVNDSEDLARTIKLALSAPLEPNLLIDRSEDFLIVNVAKQYEDLFEKPSRKI